MNAPTYTPMRAAATTATPDAALVIARLTLTRPDDWHLHLRDGDIMASVLLDAAQSGDIDTTVDGEAVPTKGHL